MNSIESSIQKRILLSRALGVIAGSVPVVAFFMPKATVAMMAVFILIGWGGLYLLRGAITRPPATIFFTVIALSVWSLISVFWTIDAQSGLFGAFKLIGNLVLCMMVVQISQALDRREQAVVIRALAVGWSLTVVLLGVETLFGSPIYELVRGPQFQPREPLGPFWLNAPMSLVLLLTLPIVYLTIRSWGRTIGCVAFIAVMTLAAMVGFRTGILALGCGGLVAVLVSFFGRRAVYVLAAITLVLSVTFPIVPSKFGTPSEAAAHFEWLPNSAQHRIAIWTFTAGRIMERPLAGWGMNSARDIPGGKTNLTYINGLPMGEAMPLHPHNMVLQLWLELGVPGLITYIAFVLALFRLALVEMKAAALVSGEIIVGLILANISYGIWQAWWLSTLALAATLTILVAQRATAETTAAS